MSASPLAVDITDILEYLICQKEKKLWSENFEKLHSCELKSKCSIKTHMGIEFPMEMGKEEVAYY